MTSDDLDDIEQVVVVASTGAATSAARQSGCVEVVEEASTTEEDPRQDAPIKPVGPDDDVQPMSAMQKGVLVAVAVILALGIAYLVKFWLF